MYADIETKVQSKVEYSTKPCLSEIPIISLHVATSKCFTSRSYNYGFRYIFHFKVNYGSPLTGILHRSPRWFYPSLRRSSSSLRHGHEKNYSIVDHQSGGVHVFKLRGIKLFRSGIPYHMSRFLQGIALPSHWMPCWSVFTGAELLYFRRSQ